MRAVAIDANGFVWLGTDSGTVERLSPVGGLLWTYSGHAKPVFGLAVDHLNNVHTASKDNTIHKLNFNGELQWIYEDHISDVTGIAVDGNQTIYTSSLDGTIRKINRRGDIIWSYNEFVNTQAKLLDVSVDVNFNVYACTNTGRIIKLSSVIDSDSTGQTDVPIITKVWDIRLVGLAVNAVATSPLAGVWPDQ